MTFGSLLRIKRPDFIIRVPASWKTWDTINKRSIYGKYMQNQEKQPFLPPPAPPSPLHSSAPSSASSRLLALSQGMKRDSGRALSVRVSEWPRGEEAGEAELGGVQNRSSWGEGEREGEEERSGGDCGPSSFRGKKAASSSS